MIGRADTISALRKRLPQRRFVSVVGTGGIGKTTVALATAEALVDAYPHGVWFAELAPLHDPQLVPGALASVLGLTIHSEDIVGGLMAYVRDKQMLIVLDNCEHVIEAAAAVAEQILASAPNVHILATSREPLRARGEHVHRLPALESPPHASGLTAAEALSFPTVQLFVERAAASLDDFELVDADAPVVADICHKLDGIALAIELAAARIDTFGVQELASLLENRLWLLNQGRRTAPARQQALVATLDWSYQLLSDLERLLLRRLSVFTGDFTLDSAIAVVAYEDVAMPVVVEGLAGLVAKSLISADVSGAIVQYRMLSTTRAYSLQKLTESNEQGIAVRRHAEYHRNVLVQAVADLETHPLAEWLSNYGPRIDDVRSALNWAFSASGDVSIGVALTVAAIPLWRRLALMGECRSRIERALASDRTEAQYSDHDLMRLCAALAGSLLITRGPRPETGNAWIQTLQIAELINEREHQLWALWGLSSYHRARGSHRMALTFAERCRSTAGEKGDGAAELAADRLVAAALLHLGRLGDARRLSERVLSPSVRPVRQSHGVSFPYDQRIGALGVLAMVRWLQGFPDEAAQLAQTTLVEAQAKFSGAVLGDTLLHGPFPIAVYVGDWGTAERLLVSVKENLANHSLSLCDVKARCLQGVLLIHRGNVVGVPQLREALDELREAEFHMRYPAYLGTLAQGLGLEEQVGEALNTIENAIEISERNEEYWCLPELLRIKGDLLLMEKSAEAVGPAEDCYMNSLEWARRQETLSWQLRTAVSLAKLRRDQDRCEEAVELLSSVYGRFNEGFETLDLKKACALIDECRTTQR
jgi:predicted ATPase